MEPVRVGIIGCGAVVQGNYSRALGMVAGVRVVALHDRDERAASQASAIFGAPSVSFDELTEMSDAALIATPPSSHVDLVARCLELRIPVLCEKPFVSREEDARKLVALSESLRVPLYVGHLRRTFAAARAARDLIASGVLGGVRSLDLAEGGRFSWDTASNYVTTDIAGGVLFDTGSHTVDLGLFVSGLDAREFRVEVEGVHRDKPEPSHDLRATARLVGEHFDVALSLRLSRRRVLSNRIRIVCENGTVELSVGPRDRIRITGPSGTAIVPAREHVVDFNEHFADQFARVLVRGDADDFSARRFIGLTAVLEALAAAKERP